MNEDVLKKLKAIKYRFELRYPQYRLPEGFNGLGGKNRGWYHTNFTHEQLEGNIKNCIAMIDELIATLETIDKSDVV